MSYQNAYKANKIIETIENYAVSAILNHTFEKENLNQTIQHFFDAKVINTFLNRVFSFTSSSRRGRRKLEEFVDQAKSLVIIG